MQHPIHPLHIAARVTAAIIGGYVFTWGCVVLSVSSLVALRMPYDQALVATMLGAFVIFLCVLLWSFAAASIARVWCVLLGGGGLMTALAWWLQRLLIG